MKKTKVLNPQALLATCADTRKAVSTSSVTLSALILIAAGVAYFLSLQLDDKSSALYMGMVTLAIAFGLVSVYRFVTTSIQVVYAPTGSAIRKDFCYFESDQLQRVRTSLEGADFAQLLKVDRKQGGNVRLDYLSSADGNFIALQLYQYIPYTYEPVTEVITFRNEDAKTLSAYLRRR